MHEFTNLDTNFKNLVANTPGGERVLNCYLCGTCTAGCPMSEIDSEYNPRKIMRQILIGLKDEVLTSKDLWKCYQCHTCVAHCPQDVRFADVIRAVRELAVKEGVVSKEFREQVEQTDLQFRKDRLSKVNELLCANAE